MDKIIIYGAGNMGKAVFELLKGCCDIIGFIDGNPNLKGKTVMGVPVYHLMDADSNPSILKAAALVAMTVCPYSEMREKLTSLGFSKVFPAGKYVAAQYEGHTILNVWSCDEFPDADAFSDAKSFENYDAACKWFSQNLDRRLDLTGNKYFPEFLSGQLSVCKTMLDTAALDGGYIETFLHGSPGRSAYAYILTPPTVSTSVLKEKFKESVQFFEKEAAGQDGVINCKRVGLMNPFTQLKDYVVPSEKIDITMTGTPFNYLRCYSISEALPILKGGERSIKKYRPLIAVNMGHYKSDFLEIPTYLKSICRDYYFYFRMHSYQGNDCILYAVPQELGG